MKTTGVKVLIADVALPLKGELGSSTVEFAVTLTLLFSCVFGIMVCSMALYADHFVVDAAKQATRYAMVRGSSWSGTSCSTYSSYSCVANTSNVTSFVDSIVPPGINASNVNVTTTWPGTDPTGATCDTVAGDNSPACVVNVKVQYSFNFLLPFVPFGSVNLSGVSSDVIIR